MYGAFENFENINHQDRLNVSNINLENPLSKIAKKPCKCGSITHSRISHFDCPLNMRHSLNTIANQSIADEHTDSFDDFNRIEINSRNPR